MKKALLGVAVVALLAGCAPEATPTGDADPVPVPTVTVTATPAPAEPGPDYGFTFFEEVTLGSTFLEASDQLNYPVRGIPECPYYAPIWETELSHTYAYISSEDLEAGIELFYQQLAFDSDNPHYPRNAEGVGLGSTEAEIMAAFPDASSAVVSDLGAGDITVITVEDPDSDARYAYGFSSGASVVDMFQWGLNAGGQWSHLCGGF